MFFSHEYTTESAFFAPQDLSLADQSQAHLSQQMYVPYFARAKVTKLKRAALAEATYGSHPLLLQLLLLNADASHDRRIDGGYDATYATIHTGGHLLSLALDHQRWMCHLLVICPRVHHHNTV